MRQHPLTGYILHQRAYRETSQLVDFFSLECGLIRGVMRGSKKLANKGRQYQKYTLYADGKTDLKRFSKLEVVQLLPPLQGQGLYTGMYANELLVKVLLSAEPMPKTFQAYQILLDELSHLPKDTTERLTAIKIIVRKLEYQLLAELGYGVNFQCDNKGQKIDSDLCYRFVHGEGFMVDYHGFLQGSWLNAFDPSHIYADDTRYLAHIFRQSIDKLVNYKPFKSSELWISLYHTPYQK